MKRICLIIFFLISMSFIISTWATSFIPINVVKKEKKIVYEFFNSKITKEVLKERLKHISESKIKYGVTINIDGNVDIKDLRQTLLLIKKYNLPKVRLRFRVEGEDPLVLPINLSGMFNDPVLEELQESQSEPQKKEK